jgi:hypothetical protein
MYVDDFYIFLMIASFATFCAWMISNQGFIIFPLVWICCGLFLLLLLLFCIWSFKLVDIYMLFYNNLHVRE